MSTSTEERVIEKIRKALIADATIVNYTNSRVYASHISSIEEPKYPAISLHLLFSKSRFAEGGMVDVTVQIDSWFPAADYTMADIMTVHRKIRETLNRQNLTDTAIGIKVASSVEGICGPLLHEEDTNLLHYPAQYNIVAS